jgi:hypothetical protein
MFSYFGESKERWMKGGDFSYSSMSLYCMYIFKDHEIKIIMIYAETKNKIK